MYASTFHGGWLDPFYAIQLIVDLIVPNWYEPIA
jgi:hypothetical protein